VCRSSHLRLLAALLFAIPTLAWPKEELIPTRPKSRDRQGPPNPLHDVADDMHTVGRRLDEAKTDETTQGAQEAILKKLNHLMEQAKEQSQQPPKGGQGDSKKQQKQQKKKQPQEAKQQKEQKEKSEKEAAAKKKKEKQTNRPGIGQPGSGDPTGAIHTDAEEWGNLPPAIRDQLLQTQGEGFPLKYRELLRRYYRELFKPKE